MRVITGYVIILVTFPQLVYTVLSSETKLITNSILVYSDWTWDGLATNLQVAYAVPTISAYRNISSNYYQWQMMSLKTNLKRGEKLFHEAILVMKRDVMKRNVFPCP